MKIAVINAKGLPPYLGGIEHYCAAIYPRMIVRGHSLPELLIKVFHSLKSAGWKLVLAGGVSNTKAYVSNSLLLDRQRSRYSIC